MVSNLRLKKDALKLTSLAISLKTPLKHSLKLLPTMASYMKQGINIIERFLIFTKYCVIKFISMLSKDTMDKGLFFSLTCTFNDEYLWIIDSGALRHMTRECGQL